MRKILYILPYLSIGGTEKHVLDLITGFEEKYEIFLLAPPGETQDEFTAHRLRYYPFTRLDQRPIKGIREFVQGLRSILRRNRIDLIHIHGAPELILLVKMFCRGIPILFTVHGFHGPRKMWDYRGCARTCNWFASEVIAVAGAEEEILLNLKIKPDLIKTIHNGVPDPSKLSFMNPELLRTFEDKVIIGAVARLEETKGIRYLIEAFSANTEKFPNTLLCIVGTGSKEAELKDLVTRLGLDHRVIFTGYRRNVHDYLHLYDIFVIPSLHEAHPLVLMEGLGHGKPIIATTVGGIPEVINHKSNGLLVPPANASALAETLEELLSDQALKNKIGQCARETYEERFTVERMVEETEKVYHSLFRSES